MENVSESIPPTNPPNDVGPSPHPDRNRPALIPRLGSRQKGLEGLARAVGASTLSAPLASRDWHYGEPMFGPAPAGAGLDLDPETYQWQWPVSKRSKSYRALPWGSKPKLDAETASVSATELSGLINDVLSLQINGGATLLRPPYLQAGQVGTRARKLDITMQTAGVKRFRDEGLAEPPPGFEEQCEREIYVTLAIAVEDIVSSGAREELVQAYCAMSANGIHVMLTGFHERAQPHHIWAGTALLAALQREGQVPVVCSRPGNLTEALLACGISVMLGIAGGEKVRTAPGEPVKGQIIRSAYHRKMGRSYQLPSGKVAGRSSKAVFAAVNCPCGEHEPGVPPTNAELDRHTLRARVGAWQDLVQRAAIPERQRSLRERLVDAQYDAEQLEVEALPLAVVDTVFAAARGDDLGSLDVTG